MADDDTRLSRNGCSHPAGKLVARLDIPVSEELEQAIVTLATLAGMPKAEYARGLLERAVFGELPMVRRLSQGMVGGRWEESPK